MLDATPASVTRLYAALPLGRSARALFPVSSTVFHPTRTLKKADNGKKMRYGCKETARGRGARRRRSPGALPQPRMLSFLWYMDLEAIGG